MRTRQGASSLLPLGASSFHILLALADGERHGADIAEEVETATRGSIRLMPGALYRYLKQMAADGWIVESQPDHDDARRRYYRLTSWGRKIAQAEAQRLDAVVTLARSRRLLPSLG
jgi:DNA-binding PadR family transcriptional regulator